MEDMANNLDVNNLIHEKLQKQRFLDTGFGSLLEQARYRSEYSSSFPNNEIFNNYNCVFWGFRYMELGKKSRVTRKVTVFTENVSLPC